MALARNPGGNLGVSRPADEIAGRIFGADFLGLTIDHHLAVQFEPDEEQADPVISGYFISLAAAVIGKEDEAVPIKILEQYGALTGSIVVIHRGQDHGRGIGNGGLPGLIEPGRELVDRIGFEIRSMQPARQVFPPKVTDIHLLVLN